MISVRPIAPHEWPKYRDIRLQALQDAPDAFGSTWAAEATQADEHWSARMAAAAASDTDRALFAVHGETVCGLVWCKLSAAEPGVADIYQMWVAPTARGLGAGRALLSQALAWAKSRGTQRVRLGVTVADSPAMQLYRSHGFAPVGEPEPLRAGSALMAQAMELGWSTPTAH
ncbi:GNAT family N-acetyltransferase [Comamonas sp. CMM03]|uniref:GNAT family N-acetyltransferase n=1 Tax=Comamonas sp. CMM03 TaxID=2854781 RepID=UPI001C441428|nr:GNAT family N-acetyltransferase [Comamonas sp. CMM03]MBV7420360.1 GNAT family N-acetyltransferase [Comamonas sp. CMM03]